MAITPRSPLPPRSTLYTGTVAACGLWFPAQLPEPLRVERLIGAWRAGCHVFKTPAGELFVEFEAARLMDCQASPALVLVRDGSIAQSAPLRANERPEASSAAGLVIVEGGRARFVDERELVEIDPGELLDIGPLAFEVVQPLGAPPELAAPAPVPDAQRLFDDRIGRSAADHARQRELLAALGALPPNAATAPGTLARGAPRGRAALPVALELGRAALSRILRWLSSSSKPGASANAPRALPPASRDATPAPRTNPTPSLFARVAERLSRWFTNVFLRSRFALLLERKQAQYLQHLLELLDAEDDLLALKHAIPLSDTPGESARPALSAPAPRAGLEIDLGRARAASSLVLADDLFARLRRSYEAVFERLDRAGRFDEAAFVLAELLADAARAVAYLERHGRLVLAAELAEARALASGLVVRQWFLAKDRKRALQIAARLGAFGDAIQRLERSGHQNEALSLRLLYAERLATAGKLALAAQQASAVPGARALVLDWLEAARSLGDFSAVTLELELQPARFEAIYQSLVPLLEAPAPDDCVRRRALAEQLLAPPRQRAELLPLARELARALLVDTAATGDDRGIALARRLSVAVGGAFRADFPRSAPRYHRSLTLPVQHRFTAADAGILPVFDVFKVAHRLLLALGEAGVRLCDTTGRELAHFDVPAHRLVVAPGSPHVLALAPRGSALRVSRIHLAKRRSQPWTELVARSCAASFDGESWLIAHGSAESSELLAIDATSDHLDVLRRVPLPAFAAVTVQLEQTECLVIGETTEGALELLRYQADKLTLRQRSPIALAREQSHDLIRPRVAAATNGVAVWDTYPDAEGMLRPRLRYGDRPIPLPPDDLTGVAHLWAEGGEFAVVIEQRTGVRVLAGSLHLARTTLNLSLEGATSAWVRLCSPLILIGDSEGRVLAYSLGAGELVHDVRVR